VRVDFYACGWYPQVPDFDGKPSEVLDLLGNDLDLALLEHEEPQGGFAVASLARPLSGRDPRRII
jgi:hypothetical protein